MAEMRFWSNPRVFVLVIVVLLVCCSVAVYLLRFQPITTVILVRHAEKNIEPNNPDPDLSPAGQARAQELVRILSNAGITAIYATQYRRTQQTAKPIAERLELQVIHLDAGNTPELVKQIRRSNAGGVVFVVGHNNTVPQTIASLGGGNVPVIPESEFDNMFVVTIYRFGRAKVVKLKYGNATATGGGTGTMVP